MQPINNVIINGNDANPNNQANNQNEDNIAYIQAIECRYIDYLEENEKTIYEKFLNKGCCGSGNNKMTITLLVYSIIILIFTIAGFIFRISNNEGYKAYKTEIEKVLILVDANLPDDSEMKKILNFVELAKEFKDYYNYNDYSYNNFYQYFVNDCSYDLFRIGLCTWSLYEKYCNYDNFYNGACNYVDHMVYIYEEFICTYEDYSNKYCSYQQYLDYTSGYLNEFIYYGGKPKRIDINANTYYLNENDNDAEKVSFDIKNIHGISFLQFWCDIGKNDSLFLISLSIIIILFIIFLIIDLCINKDNISNGVLYYIVLVFYMIFYLIFRIFVCLLFGLLVYSIVVTSSTPESGDTIYSLINNHNSYHYHDYDYDYKYNYNYNTFTSYWDDKRVYAIVDSVIILLLFIFVSMLDGLKVIIINYLGFNFEGNKKIEEIKRNISIRFVDEIHEIEIKNKKDVYLDENISRKKIKFKEIKFDKLGNDIYYLKISNKGLLDQFGFSEWNYPNINEGFKRLGEILDLIYVVLFFSVLLTKFQINNEYTYRFLKYAIELGLSFKLNKYVENYGELEKSLTNYRLYAYVIISIIILLFMLKRAFFGGFKSNLFFWIFFIISLLFILFNLASFLLTILLDVLSWISLDVFSTKFHFEDEILVIPKLAIQGSLNIIILIIQLIIFGKSIAYTVFIFSMKTESNNIENQNQNEISNKDEGFEFMGRDMRKYYFQPINNTRLPKNLFYIKAENRRRQIFIPENAHLIIQSGQQINNNNQINNNIIQNINNNINNIPDRIILNNNIINNNNQNRENIIRENNNSESPININNDENETIRLTNENRRLKNENEILKQKIQFVKSELGRYLGIK